MRGQGKALRHAVRETRVSPGHRRCSNARASRTWSEGSMAEQRSVQCPRNGDPSHVQAVSPSAPSTRHGVRPLTGLDTPHKGLSTPRNRLRLPWNVSRKNIRSQYVLEETTETRMELTCFFWFDPLNRSASSASWGESSDRQRQTARERELVQSPRSVGSMEWGQRILETSKSFQLANPSSSGRSGGLLVVETPWLSQEGPPTRRARHSFN